MAGKRQHRAARSFGFERLDRRLCLAVDAVLDENGVLTITGTPEDDTILIRDNRQGEIIVDSRGQDERLEPFEGVQEIVVNALDGNDRVIIHQHFGQTSIPLSVDLGRGDDSLQATVRFGRDNESPALDLDVTAGEGDDDVAVGLLLPAVQKVRDAAARASIEIDLGGGDDRLRVNGRGGSETTIDITAGEGDDEILIGMLLPAVQKVRDAAGAASLDVTADLGGGNDKLRIHEHGAADTQLDITAGAGDDEILIGMLLPAVQKVREAAARASVEVDLGAGNDALRIHGHGAAETTLDVTAGDGDDDVVVGLLLPAVQKVRDAAARASIDVDLGAGNDSFSMRGLGIEQVDMAVSAGDGDDEVLIGLLLPAVQKVQESSANIDIDLGPGADELVVKTRNYDTVETNLSGDDDEGDSVELDEGPDRPTPPAGLPRGRGRP